MAHLISTKIQDIPSITTMKSRSYLCKVSRINSEQKFHRSEHTVLSDINKLPDFKKVRSRNPPSLGVSPPHSKSKSNLQVFKV